MGRRIGGLVALCAVVLWVGTAVAGARPVAAAHDGRPNLLVVMTDDMALSDLQFMPNVRKLLAAQGTSFADAVDSFPLCCPSRATFISGQYAHNHGVGGNFFPYGWYGMRDRGNILPTWLQSAGYHTAAIGKWLNGYGALDGHGEIPKGFDEWRGLLDVSAYDYFNYVMNDDGNLRSWGDPDFAAKLVKFAKVEVSKLADPGIGEVLRQLTAVMGPAPYSYWGAENAKDYSPDVTGQIANDLVAGEATSKDPFFIWWSPAAPHREDVAVALMGRPGPDPRPAPRYRTKVASLHGAARAELQRGRPRRQALEHARRAAVADRQADRPARPGLPGPRRRADGRRRPRQGPGGHAEAHRQLDDTLILFTSDNGWLQGQHRVPGDKFLPYEESLRVPLILRGPGIPKDETVHGQVANIDFAPTMVAAAHAKAGRTMDGVSLLGVARRPSTRPDRAIGLEALDRLFEGDFPVMFNGWDRPYRGVRTDRYTYVRYTETGDRELYDRAKDPDELRNVAAEPAYAKVVAHLAARMTALSRCKGAACARITP